jgi:hypothetical protein
MLSAYSALSSIFGSAALTTGDQAIGAIEPAPVADGGLDDRQN